MAYFRKYRRLNAELAAYAVSSSDDTSDSESRQPEPVVSSDSVSDEAVANDDSDSDDSDYGYTDRILSSDSEIDVSLGYSETDEIPSLNEELSAWATKNLCTRTCVNEILNILRRNGHDLPKDVRSLLHTPRHVPCEEKCGGQYVYFGIEAGILKCLDRNMKYKDNHNSIELIVNIDGLPLFKSSQVQLWPILGLFENSNVFIIGLFCGSSKPNSVEQYLHDFIEEVKKLEKDGISHEDKKYIFSIRSFICDAPARSYLKCIIGHTGYYSCERCVIKGTYVSHRVVFDGNEVSDARKTNEFNNFAYHQDHQKRLTPLVEITKSCIHQFTLDYMHLVCLGVVKRMLTFLKQGPRICKLSNLQLQEISNHLKSLNGMMPSEFARQPRSLFELDRWKATEYRQFLLYTGPIVLKGVVSNILYDHFLALHVAMSIMLNSNSETRKFYLNYAQELIDYFVRNAADIYGNTFTVYNVHSLKHVPEDVKNMDCSLNEISAFPFENYMQTLKKHVRNSQNPVVQVAKRQAEKEGANYLKAIRRKSYTLSIRFKDSCFQLMDKKFCLVKEKCGNDKFVCEIINPTLLDNLFEKPLASKTFDIAVIKNIDRIEKVRRTVHKSQLLRKVVILPWKTGYVCYPLLHEIERLN